MSDLGKKRDAIHVGLGIVIHEGKILISQRKKEALLGGLWEFPGGKIEKDESVEACIIRELMEELGIDVLPKQRLATIVEEYDHGQVHLHPMLCDLVGGHAQAIGVAQFKWVDAADLSNYPFPRANRDLIKTMQTK